MQTCITDILLLIMTALGDEVIVDNVLTLTISHVTIFLVTWNLTKWIYTFGIETRNYPKTLKFRIFYLLDKTHIINLNRWLWSLPLGLQKHPQIFPYISKVTSSSQNLVFKCRKCSEHIFIGYSSVLAFYRTYVVTDLLIRPICLMSNSDVRFAHQTNLANDEQIGRPICKPSKSDVRFALSIS